MKLEKEIIEKSISLPVKILSEKIKLILIFFLLFSIKQHYESESIIFFLQMPNSQPTTYIKHFKMEV